MKKQDLNRFIFDLELANLHNVEWIVGIDEVGYGCFAGDIVVGAVAVSKSTLLMNWEKLVKEFPLLLKVKDSKKTSEKLREEINSFLTSGEFSKLDFYHAIGTGKVEEINRLGVTSAHNLATARALKSLLDKKSQIGLSNLIILDGNKIDECLKEKNALCVVKGDDKSFTVAASSIIAKVFRDNEMKKLHGQYSIYNFISNKGYGTKDHTDAIAEFGITAIHRLKYCRNFLK